MAKMNNMTGVKMATRQDVAAHRQRHADDDEME
jgi:hypothetical protein